MSALRRSSTEIEAATSAASFVAEVKSKLRETRIPFDTEVEIASEATTAITLQPIKVPVEGTGIPGYPETQEFAYSTAEYPFKARHFEFDDDVNVDDWAFQNMFVGQRLQWRVAGNSLPARILAQRPKIKFDVVMPNLFITLQVTNVSKSPRRLRGWLVGDELVSGSEGEIDKFSSKEGA